MPYVASMRLIEPKNLNKSCHKKHDGDSDLMCENQPKLQVLTGMLALFFVTTLWADPLSTTNASSQTIPELVPFSTQDQLLNSTGIEQTQARKKLDQRQKQLQLLIPQTSDPQKQLQLIEQRLGILHTLVVDARLNQQARQINRWKQAMRSDAWLLRQSDNPKLQIIGEYWHLLCDLSDIRRLARDLESSQRACIKKLEEFLEHHTSIAEPNEPQAMHLLQQTRLALLQLYDQRGLSMQACKIIKRLKALDPENNTLSEYLQKNYGYCHLLGRAFNMRLLTMDGQTWDSRDKKGKPILIYFWPGVGLENHQNQAGTNPLWNQMHSLASQVLLVDLSHTHDSGMQISASPWPSYRQEPGQFQITDYFNIQTLPRIAVIDNNGIICAVGGPATVNELDTILTKK